MKSASSRIWTRITVSISYDDNHYTTGTSISMDIFIIEMEAVFTKENSEIKETSILFKIVSLSFQRT